MAKTYDSLFRVLLMGGDDVGKSCILGRFSEDAFGCSTSSSTLGKWQDGFKNRRVGSFWPMFIGSTYNIKVYIHRWQKVEKSGGSATQNAKLIIHNLINSLFLARSSAVGEREVMNCLELSRALRRPQVETWLLLISRHHALIAVCIVWLIAQKWRGEPLHFQIWGARAPLAPPCSAAYDI